MSSFKVEIKKINNCVIKDPIKKVKDDRPPRCKDLFSDPYSNVFIVARKKSGKSTLVSNIIKKTVGRNTHVIIFCSTIHKDPVWISIKDWLKKNNIKYTSFLGIQEGKTDHLKQFMTAREQESLEQELSEEEEEQIEDGGERKQPKYFSDSEDENDEDKEQFETVEEDENDERFQKVPFSKIAFTKPKPSVVKKEPYITPEYLVIIDDLSNELKSPTLEAFYKRSRHYKCFTVSSTQYANDVKPASLRQQDVIISFKGLDLQKLKKLYVDADITDIPFEVFCDMYHNATSDRFGFFYIGVRDGTYRKNFDKQYIISV